MDSSVPHARQRSSSASQFAVRVVVCVRDWASDGVPWAGPREPLLNNKSCKYYMFEYLTPESIGHSLIIHVC